MEQNNTLLNSINNLLSTLQELQAKQLQNCMQKGRYIVYSLLGSTWLTLKENVGNSNTYTIYLLIALVFLVVYLALELFHYILTATKARKCHEETLIMYKEYLKELDASPKNNAERDNQRRNSLLDTANKMNKTTDWAVRVFIFQLIMLGFSVFLLGMYYYKILY